MASARPTFAQGGAPVSVLLDFDGTISLADVGDALIERFVPDAALVAEMDRRYDDGVLGSRELMAWDLDVLPRDGDLLLESAMAIPLDDTLAALVSVVRDVGAAIEVVSDGLGFHVEPMLARIGLGDLAVATNAATLGRGGAGLGFPFGHPSCLVCGTCKRERVRVHQAADRAVVFVGDGTSDRYAAHHADVVFAKAGLGVYCERTGLPFIPWARLDEVARWVHGALAEGRLPADQGAFETWAAEHRVRPEVFVCGPEAWEPSAGRPRLASTMTPMGRTGVAS
jgi:2,3-diketo-5-methylthio-1-phosphopentane phosphatase